MTDPLDFRGRRAVVTGAGGGIGGAVVELLLERGATVVATDLAKPGLARAASLGAHVVEADVGTAAGRAAIAAAAGGNGDSPPTCSDADSGGGDSPPARVAGVDHVVVAHGTIRPKPIADTTEDDWDTIVGVNAKAVYFLLQGLTGQIVDGGSVVTVSSISARSAASQEQSVYCASKAAVSSITRSFAYLLAPRGIRVNTVLPGIVETPMQDGFLAAAAAARGTTAEELNEARLRLVPLGRPSPPRECAETIVWLLSPAAGYLTGQQIAADGGLTMV